MTTLVSGAPIIQNGKIIGAVTHVLINDPARGMRAFKRYPIGSAYDIGRDVIRHALWAEDMAMPSSLIRAHFLKKFS